MTPEPAAAREFVFTRTLDAPRALVFAAWTDPKHLAQWWGPHHFTNPVCEADPRPGGALYIEMRGPDGTTYPMDARFVEVVPPERLAFTTFLKNDAGTVVLEVFTRVAFAERDGKTVLTLNAHVVTAGPGSEEFLSGMEEGWSQSLERLAAHIAAGQVSGSAGGSGNP
ncbi:MAG: hypothetical protein QOI11_3218 [Candidatus Eremiobacteraeota bacterium]|jgi:uncharacterized protein YndB with AHSA1/START domain|nr:hypothetical protein [Candidatus Eremiobacteraeota bacterium]